MNLGLGQAASQVSAFLRSIILAGLMRPADYGVVAACAMTLPLLEMAATEAQV